MIFYNTKWLCVSLTYKEHETLECVVSVPEGIECVHSQILLSGAGTHIYSGLCEVLMSNTTDLHNNPA